MFEHMSQLHNTLYTVQPKKHTSGREIQYGSNANPLFLKHGLSLQVVEVLPLQVLADLPTLVPAPHLILGQRSPKVPQLKIEGRPYHNAQ